MIIAIKEGITLLLLLTTTLVASMSIDFNLDDLNGLVEDRYGEEWVSSVEEQLEEYVEDFNSYLEEYAEWWVEENEDWILEEGKVTQEDLEEMQGEALEHYLEDYRGDNYNLDEDVYKHLKNQLSQEELNRLERQSKANGESIETLLEKHFLREELDKSNKKKESDSNEEDS